MKKRIYHVLVENRAGVLGKVVGLFSRRCFNIDSLVVGETDDPNVSCMTIVSSGDERTIEQIEKQLNKKNTPAFLCRRIFQIRSRIFAVFSSTSEKSIAFI